MARGGGRPGERSDAASTQNAGTTKMAAALTARA
jgi:hypothetical protein